MEGRTRREASFYQQFRATLIRNLLRKKRALRHTLREILAPIYFLAIIIILKLAIPEPFYAQVDQPQPPIEVFSTFPFQYTERADLIIIPSDLENHEFMLQLQNNPTLKIANFTFLDSEEDLEQLFDQDPNQIYAAIIFNDYSLDTLDYQIRFSSQDPIYALPGSYSKIGGNTECRVKGKPTANQKELGLSAFFPIRKRMLGNLGGKMSRQIRSVEQDEGPYTKIQDGPDSLFGFPAPCSVGTYYWSGFSTIQAVIDNEWMKFQLAKSGETFTFPKIALQMMPKHEFTGTAAVILRSIIPLYLVISLSQFITPMLIVVVDEKEKKIKESMKMVGLRDSVFWLSWFAVYSVMVLIIAIIGSVLVYFVVIKSTNFWVLFVLMFEFGLSMIMFAFMLTSLFSKAKPAGIVGGLSTMLLSCLYYLQVFLSGSHEIIFWLLGLLSPTAFAMGVDKLMYFDLESKQLDLWDPADSIPVAGVMIMLAVDIVLYLLIAFYLDNVVPTEYGTRRKPWYFLQPSYWKSSVNSALCARKSQVNDPDRMQKMRSLIDESNFNGPDFEAIPSSMKGREAIVINQLKKTFKSLGSAPVHAVKDISLKIYPGEITAILGHNGAGKSTLFNMLTGMTSITSGSADIFGFDVTDSNQMEEIRKITGICPQHDVLFDELTPREHLTFFARIRGMEESEIPQEVESILKDTNLEEKADAVALNLSGGQKRKLSVGIALIGDPKIIFLDEPTAGVDPYSRRHLWSVLKERKEGKVILLTTHFMDEADILADRKAIVSDGKVRCYGSSLFLKNKFGVGYHLTLVLEPSGNISEIRELVKRFMPDAEQNRLFGRELSFILPRDDVDKFPDLFSAIESDIDKNLSGISSYGVSMTTLEEIFLKLGEEEKAKKEVDELEMSGEATQAMISKQDVGKMNGSVAPTQHMANNQSNKEMGGFSFEAVPTEKSKWQMFWALAWVRFVRKYREPVAVLVQIVLPVVYLVLGIWLTTLTSFDPPKEEPLIISPAIYEKDFPETADSAVFSIWSPDGADLSGMVDRLNGSTLELGQTTQFNDLLSTMQMGAYKVKEFNEAAKSLDVTVLVNFTSLHSVPIIINQISNIMADLHNLDSINTISHNFKHTSMAGDFDFGSFGGTIFIGFTYVLIPIGLALELIEDREIRAKNQLRVNGLTFGLYYGSFYLVLGGMMLIVLAVLLGLVWAFQIAPLTLMPAFLTLALLYLIYTPAALLFCSAISYLFDKVENGQFLFPIASYVGFIPYIAVSLLDMFQVADGLVGKICHVVFAFLSPIYIPFGAVYYINRQFVFNLCGITTDCSEITFGNYMGQYEIYTLFIACGFHLIVWFIVLKVADVVKDGGSVREGFSFLMKNNDKYKKIDQDRENVDMIEDEDVDVRRERDEVNEYFAHNGESRVVAVQGLRKEFPTNEGKAEKTSISKESHKKVSNKLKVAVRNMTMGVQPGEVFGLLGHNGAGKTTTMRIITAEEASTAGNVKIGKHNILSNASPGFDMLGYCPQFDAVWKTITIREHLQVYAAIRGVAKPNIGRLTNQFMEGLQIEEHSNKYAKDCSGGTKRKLSYAMAMLGDPKIVLLDEPSTGMDPQSKRFVWDTILASFKDDRGAILTTHSMEEADALCTRVGIMVKGALRCLGSTQHLKNRYGSGYMLEAKLKNEGGPEEALDQHWSTLEKEILNEFPGAVLQEKFADRRTYSIPQSAFSSLASAFKTLEHLKSTHDVEEYSFGQTTLEQVFLEFAKQQEAADEEADSDEMEHPTNRLDGSQRSVSRTGSILPVTEL
ncbi:cholesterol transporter ABCA5-like isoform X1 [Tigriopus californicus]|uniref:cholesterol transporter ABCA5-like isoform X1 n=1 Tax=Tigriopus californicus TaxID=6832 RepID=UPI0027D9DC6F|nr:cholesterol transporter ABCA5-like isoform X1 [Tigriopus californicus]